MTTYAPNLKTERAQAKCTADI